MTEGRPYQPDLRPRARRKIDRLPEKVATAVLEFILGPLSDSPHRVGAPLDDEYAGQYSARRGREWRIRYEIDEETHTVRILDIAHRSDIYY